MSWTCALLGWDEISVGIAALKEWHENFALHLSEKSLRKVAKILFNFVVVKNFPDLKVKTGMYGENMFFSEVKDFRFSRAATGQQLGGSKANNSTVSPLRPLDFVKGRNNETFSLDQKITCLHWRVVTESNNFSEWAKISPILHEEKKLVRHAVQTTWIEKESQLLFASLWPRTRRASIDMAALIV